jgi:hypothetical protein
MNIIKEPEGVDFVVKSVEWTEKERLELSGIIAKERRNLTPRQRRLVKKLSSPASNLQDHRSILEE